MPIFINTNVAAMNAQRNLGVTNLKMSRALERLSSGLRVNRAADDAAGLAISEKMRAQIRGLRQGLRNAQDGISLIQTAEGALNEVHAILQRMRELTTQAGSTILSTADRQAVSEEMLTLRSEIDNIAIRARFNGLSLLTGALAISTTSAIADTDTDTATVAIDVSKADANVTYNITSAGANVTVTNATSNVAQTIATASMGNNASQTLDFNAVGVRLTMSTLVFNDGITATDLAADLNAKSVVTGGSSAATFRVGDQVVDNVTVNFANMQAAALGDGGANDIADLILDNTAVSSVSKADTLLSAIDTAIGQVSTFRAKLGAAQNQMESAVNSLGVAVENLSASESRIRDADVAEVSSELVTRQIMQQAGVAVLAQANTSPQAALALLT